MGKTNLVWIIKDQMTIANILEIDLNNVDGTVDIDIDPSPPDPIDVTMTGQVVILNPGESMTVTALVPEDTCNVIYVWYLDGEQISIEQTVTIQATKSDTNHQLTVIVFSADGARAGSCSHDFEIPFDESLPQIVVKDNGIIIEKNSMIDFGIIEPNDELIKSLMIENSGLCTVFDVIINVTNSNPDYFSVEHTISTINTGKAGSFTINYQPLANGEHIAAIEIYCNGMEIPVYTFSVMGKRYVRSGGDGGDNGRGHGGGRGPAAHGHSGYNAPANSGGGGGGAGGTYIDHEGSVGGNGGSGYIRIEWTGYM